MQPLVSKIILVVLLIYAVNVANSAVDVIETDTLLIKQINEDGFGDINNQYAFSMESFKGSLYIGTLNAINPWPIGMFQFFVGFPMNTNGTQIYKGDIRGDIWEWICVVTAGNGNKHNYGIRKLKTVGDYLYGVSANHVSGMEVWRTLDGIDWEIIVSNGFGYTDNDSGRGIIAYNQHLYISTCNSKTGASIYKRSITINGSFEINSTWNHIISNGITDSDNMWFADFVQYKGWLYIGTGNLKGMQLWRSDGIKFEKIFDNGNGNVFDLVAMKLYVYDNTLYIGTMNFKCGASLYVNIDEQGTQFNAIFTNGNGDVNNAYVWYMEKFNGRLYVSTFKRAGSGFSLFSSTDPKSLIWTIETNNAFGIKYHYGLRTMTVFMHRLILGSATPRNSGACKVFEAIPRDIDTQQINQIQSINHIVILVLFVVFMLLTTYIFWLIKAIKGIVNKV